MREVTGKEAIVEILRNEGVEYVFGIPGATEVLLMDALEGASEIKYILGLHEVVVVGMAESYSRTSGKVGVVNLHTCAGLAAAMPMILNAYLGKVPLVITAGQQDTRLQMWDPHMTGDLIGLASYFTKWSTEVAHAADIPLTMRRAFKIATHPPTGPVFVSLPQDIMEQSLDFEYTSGTAAFVGVRPAQDEVNKAVKLLANSQNPAIIVEDGVARHNALAEVVKLAELTGSRVYQAWMSDVNFPTSHPQYMRDLNVISPQTGELLESVDVLIVIGAPLFAQPLYLSKPLLTQKTKIIQIDDDAWQIAKNFPVAAAIEGNIRVSLSELNTSLQNSMSVEGARVAKIRAEKISHEKMKMEEFLLKKDNQEKDLVPISVSRLMRELRNEIKPATIVIDDCWSCSPVLRRTIDLSDPQGFQRTRGGGSIGWGMSGAIGAKLAAQSRPVVAIIGDGSAMWSIQSLWTAAHYNVPVTYIICANASYNQVRIMKHLIMGDKARGRYLGTDLSKPRIDFCQLAHSMGVQGEKVDQPDNLVKVLREALNSNGPRLVEVYIDNKP